MTTRSMTRRNLATNHIMDSSMVPFDSTTSLPPPMLPPSSSDILLSSLSSDVTDTPRVLGNFEISNFQNSTPLPTAYSVSQCDHNFILSQTFEMESNEENKLTPNSEDFANERILQMLALVSNQMMASIQDLQDQLTRTDTKLTQEIINVTQDHVDFKKEMRTQVALLRSLTPAPSFVSSASSPASSPVPVLSASTVSQVVSSPVQAQPSTLPLSANDIQVQMMQMLTDTFSKLSVALDGKTSDSKSEWPKFQGDPHLAILAQLSIPPWKEFYDPVVNNVVTTTSNTALNEKLYAKLLTCLEGAVLQNMVSRKHLRADGVSLLHELTQTFRPKNVPEVIAAKTGEFWSNTKHLSNETVDSYYNRFHDLLDDLLEGEEPISTKSAIRHFIFTLGPEFKTIQNNFRIGNLAEEWKTQDWAKLLILCRDYSNSVHPLGISKHASTSDSNFLSQNDCVAHHKKVRQWFLNTTKYCVEIETEQKRYAGKCIYHLSSSHCTDDCHIKKACDQQRSEKHQPGVSTSGSAVTGKLRNLKEEGSEDKSPEALSKTLLDTTSNDTNEADLYYFACLTNHYLQLVKSSPDKSTLSRHSMKYPVIADSGANFHMFKESEFFEDVQPFSGQVILGDGKTKVEIQGIGMV